MELSERDYRILRSITTNKQFSINSLSAYINRIKGNYYYHRDLKAIKGSRTVFSSILHHILSRNSRTSDFFEWNKIWDELPKKWVYNRYGILFSEDTPGKSLLEVFFEEIYTRFDGFAPRPNDVVFDVGSQFGDFALLCALHYKCLKVLCFEPYSKNLDIIKKNVSLNSCENITINECAVGNREKNSKIYISGNMGTKSGSGEGEDVRVVKLDSFIQENVTLLKIDTEGFELDVLKGAVEILKALKPRIILETHSIELKRKCLAFLSKYGYRLIWEGRISKSELKDMDYVQNLYLSC
jgi:FkbM family methyltransferase